MIENILKRDGSHEEFAAYKIEDAIKKAFQSEDTKYNDVIFLNVVKKLKVEKSSLLKRYKISLKRSCTEPDILRL